MKTIQHVSRSKRKQKTPPDMHICMVHGLPSEIIMDILSRLPTDSILECRQVCKTWGNLIRHPYFAQLHLRQSRSIYPCHSSVTGAKVGFGFLFLFRTLLPKEDCLLYYGEHDNQPSQKLRRLNQPAIGFHAVVGSCNGLICFSGNDYNSNIHEPVLISNPITREYVKFPRLQVDGENKVDSMVCGFGYLPSTDQYKIIRIYYIQNQPMGHVQVYTLGGGKCSGWRNIGETSYSLRHIKDGPLLCIPCPFGTFANVALHWLDKEQNIVSFDLAEEKFYLLTSPPFVGDVYLKNSYALEVLGGSLCFIHRQEGKSLDIWFLRKKGEPSSYDLNEQEYDSLTKELSFILEASPFALTEIGKFLIWYKSYILSYDPKTETLERYVLNGDLCHVIPHMNSFVSLKALGENCRFRKRHALNQN